MIVWLIELSKFKIKYQTKDLVKAQCLNDFVAELSTNTEPKSKWWRLYVNGLSNKKGSGAGVIRESLDEVILEQSLRFKFETTNNQAEYEALLAKLRFAKEVRPNI